jgi:hypothetical protein
MKIDIPDPSLIIGLIILGGGLWYLTTTRPHERQIIQPTCPAGQRWNWCVNNGKITGCIPSASLIADCRQPCGCDAGVMLYDDLTYTCVGYGRPSLICNPPQVLDPNTCQCITPASSYTRVSNPDR